MREFSKVSPAVWQSKRFIGLPSDDARYLYIYLLTCEHQTSAGIYRLKDGYACDDLRWDAKRFAKARRELVEADLIHFDEMESVVLITRWFRHNPPTSADHLTGIERVIERIPSEKLGEEAMTAAQDAWETYQAAKSSKKVSKSDATSYLKSALAGQGMNGLRPNGRA